MQNIYDHFFNLLSIFTNYPNNFLFTFSEIVSAIGDTEAMIIFVLSLFLILYFILKKKIIANFILANYTITIFIVYILKITIQKPRNPFALIDETGYAFPSGHVAAAAVTSFLIIYFTNYYIKNNFYKILLKTFAILWLPIMTFSRVYLGVHDIYDVLTSLIISLFVFYTLLNLKYFKNKI